MLSTLFLIAAAQDSAPTAASVLSKMIAHYHEAKTIKGTCQTHLVLGAKTLDIENTLQIERPLKVYLRQSAQDRTYVLTSDGRRFSYNKPLTNPDIDAHPTARLMEDVTQGLTL